MCAQDRGDNALNVRQNACCAVGMILLVCVLLLLGWSCLSLCSCGNRLCKCYSIEGWWKRLHSPCQLNPIKWICSELHETRHVMITVKLSSAQMDFNDQVMHLERNGLRCSSLKPCFNKGLADFLMRLKLYCIRMSHSMDCQEQTYHWLRRGPAQ